MNLKIVTDSDTERERRAFPSGSSENMEHKPGKDVRSRMESSEEAKRSIFKEVAPYSANFLDPFSITQTLTKFEKIKVVLLSVTLFPIRVILMSLLLVCDWIIGSVILYGMPKDQALGTEPLVGWRRNWGKRIIEEMSRAVFFVGGWYWVPHKGRRATPEEAPILLAMPHSSFFDTAVVTSLRCPGLVMKDSAEKVPIYGGLLRFTQPLYVKSDDPDSRRKIAEEIRRRVWSGKNYQQLLLFPEGGCGNRKALLQFKLGGFSPGVPVQPVFIRYKNKLDTITWAWNGPGAFKQVWLTLSQFRIYCELEFLPIYKPSELERKNPRVFATNVQNYVAHCTGISTSRFNLEDGRFLQVARENHLPPTAPFIKFLRLRHKLGNDSLSPSEELDRLESNNNQLEKFLGNVESFAKHLGQERCSEALKEFFSIIDQQNYGYVDVRAYDAALCLLRTELSTKERLNLAFQALGSRVENLPIILLLWKGIPYNLSNQKSLRGFAAEELEKGNFELPFGRNHKQE
ncbi:lysophosphatidylcholine acyltransferase 1-like [Uloborus diversus]|uniref:lysophosphatidylcholine acyltransferase 1-like n=1 Tax=Uloborus diversus TaxID=327109 RepID=UPI0024094705|nr:lysophosphatidylcholine acyltransferase 1-like [Uloborus diversus]